MSVWRQSTGVALVVLALGMSLSTSPTTRAQDHSHSLPRSPHAPGSTWCSGDATTGKGAKARRIALARYRLVKRLQPRFGFFPIYQSFDLGGTVLFPVGQSDRVYLLWRGASLLPHGHGDGLLLCYQRRGNGVKNGVKLLYRIGLGQTPSRPVARVRTLRDYLISYRFAVSAAGGAGGREVDESWSWALQGKVGRLARNDLAARRDYVQYTITPTNTLVVWLLSDITGGRPPELHKMAFYDVSYQRDGLPRDGLPVPPRELALLQPRAPQTSQTRRLAAVLGEDYSAGRLAQIGMLIGRGADIHARGQDGATALHWAALGNRLDLAQLLIEHGADVNASDEDGRTPLHEAAYRDSLEIARLLIAHGAAVNAPDAGAWTPLHWAAMYDRPSLARLLLLHGASVDAKDQNGETPLQEAACRCLRKAQSYRELAQVLIAHGANVNVRDWGGQTPLHRAADSDSAAVAQLLLEHGVNVDTPDEDGQTPLDWAAWAGSLAVAQLLLEHGANVNARTHDGGTPLHQAALGNHPALARLLLDHGADVNARAKDGATPLAVTESNLVTALLLHHGGHK